MTTKHLKRNTKRTAMIRAFIAVGDTGMNCFEATHRCHDYVLRTTVSDLHRDFGLIFHRKWEQVPNAFGSLTDCMRYWLAPESLPKAAQLVDELPA